ncbi:ion channel [Singulisphaera rosea]
MAAEKVITKTRPTIGRTFGGRYGLLLTLLLALVLLTPWLSGGDVLASPIDVLVFAVMLAGIRASASGRRPLILGMSLTVATLGVHCAAYLKLNPLLFGLHHILVLAGLAYASGMILSAILRHAEVTLETLKAAVCVYLLIGLAWVFAYAVVGMAYPGSFRFPMEGQGAVPVRVTVRDHFPDLMYFSFATLTTLGYAEMVPRGPHVQTLCYVEAIVGQIYMTILIARLVGMHISRPRV